MIELIHDKKISVAKISENSQNYHFIAIPLTLSYLINMSFSFHQQCYTVLYSYKPIRMLAFGAISVKKFGNKVWSF